jgi:RNA polymerase sigma-70 factor (ECF subfamily)
LTTAPATEPSDWELLRRSAAGGDSAAFGALAERHYRPAVAFCRQVLGDHHRAEDVVQRGFLNVFRTRDRHVERAQFRTFLYRVLLNLCLNELARRGTNVRADDPGDDESATARLPDVRAIDPAAWAERAELRAVVESAVARLAPKHRAALYLREFEGLAYDRIAEILEASLAEVKIWIYRGRRKLAVLLAPYLERGELPA